jgi:hypothetical protein
MCADVFESFLDCCVFLLFDVVVGVCYCTTFGLVCVLGCVLCLGFAGFFVGLWKWCGFTTCLVVFVFLLGFIRILVCLGRRGAFLWWRSRLGRCSRRRRRVCRWGG